MSDFSSSTDATSYRFGIANSNYGGSFDCVDDNAGSGRFSRSVSTNSAGVTDSTFNPRPWLRDCRSLTTEDEEDEDFHGNMTPTFARRDFKGRDHLLGTTD